MSVKLACWNIAKMREPWRQLIAMPGVDVSLLQEAGNPAPEVTGQVEMGPVDHYDSHVWNSNWYEGRWPHLLERWPMVVRLSDRVKLEWFKQVSPISLVEEDEIAVSGIGTIAAARVSPQHTGTQPFIVVSAYARWLSPHPSASTNFRVGYPDASAHRIISDLSAFIGNTDPGTHRIILAGDFNMSNDDDAPDQEFLRRERSVWERLDSLGLEYLGPNHTPTFRPRGQPPEAANGQLDHVFASRGFHEQVKVRALNSPEEWGASDHCRIVIDVD